MAEDDSTIDAVAHELAAIGRRVAELARVVDVRRRRGPADPRRSARRATPGPPSATPRPVEPQAPSTAAAAMAGPRARTPAPRRGSDRRAAVPRMVERRGPLLVSIVVHAAALAALAMIFVARESRPKPTALEFAATAEIPIEDPAPVEVAAETPDTDLLQLDPLTAAPVEQLPVEVAPVAAWQPVEVGEPLLPAGGAAGLDLLASVGGEAASGGAAGGPTAAAPTFFGTRGTGKTAVFLCDNSASYAEGGFQMVLAELARAIGSLQPDQAFHVVFFSDVAYPLFHPERIEHCLPATPENKHRLMTWLGTVELCVGGRGMRDAVDLAVGLRPDVVYLLSDGDHGERLVEAVASAPFEDALVHTFGMQADVIDRGTGFPDPAKVARQQAFNAKLARIAEAHGGTFRPVMVPPDAALAGRTRSVKVNRHRGPVWGTGLAPSAGPSAAAP